MSDCVIFQPLTFAGKFKYFKSVNFLGESVWSVLSDKVNQKSFMFKYIFFRMSFYAVKKGRQPGIFSTWAECEKQVKGFSGAAYKKFKSKTEAENFIGDHSTTSTATTKCFKSSAKRSRSSLEEAIEQRRIEELLREALENEEMLPSSSKKQKNNDYKIPPAQLKKYGNHYFQEDKHGYVQVFTDGSCENNGKKHAIAGLGVYFGDDHPLNASEAILGKATNNIGKSNFGPTLLK